jgi:hypothetical protein
VTRIDPGVVSLVSDLRAHERQATEELGQGNGVEERKPRDASPAAATRTLLLTGEELDSLEKRALELEKSRGADDRVDQMSDALSRLRAMGKTAPVLGLTAILSAAGQVVVEGMEQPG